MAGGFRLFRIFGITVYLHFTWFIIAILEIQARKGLYDSIGWNVAEYLTLFAIVLLHEFGHALGCRSVGGRADTIMLWPLGGIAYVGPPPRPGAVLWSIAAGPLVNVLLLPVTLPFLKLAPDRGLHTYLYTIASINLGLLLFNMLPIYPLDGGQIVQALLWFVIGRARSLMVAAVLGIIGAIGLAGAAVYFGNYWLIVLAIFAGIQAWRGINMAVVLRQRETMARRAGYACPNCGQAPPVGPFWNCSNCRRPFDTFERNLVCPNCGSAHRVAFCPSCRTGAPLSAWMGMNPQMPPLPPVAAPVPASPPLPPIPPPPGPPW
jgi:Zn-dependent protease/DNA-directed RNA polymerase subunit RPC12/RpoP